MGAGAKQDMGGVATIEAAAVLEGCMAVFEEVVAFFGQGMRGSGRALTATIGYAPAAAIADFYIRACGGDDATNGFVTQD